LFFSKKIDKKSGFYQIIIEIRYNYEQIASILIGIACTEIEIHHNYNEFDNNYDASQWSFA